MLRPQVIPDLYYYGTTNPIHSGNLDYEVIGRQHGLHVVICHNMHHDHTCMTRCTSIYRASETMQKPQLLRHLAATACEDWISFSYGYADS